MANSFRPIEGTLWARLFGKRTRHPSLFDCGVRVRAGHFEGESGRWRYKLSAVDPVRGADGTVVLRHGDAVTLRLIVDPDSLGEGDGRAGEFTFLAVEQTSRAAVQISAPGAELHRFGIDVF